MHCALLSGRKSPWCPLGRRLGWPVSQIEHYRGKVIDPAKNQNPVIYHHLRFEVTGGYVLITGVFPQM
jgi:hypothetical protein